LVLTVVSFAHVWSVIYYAHETDNNFPGEDDLAAIETIKGRYGVSTASDAIRLALGFWQMLKTFKYRLYPSKIKTLSRRYP
jgi:hypothetical protein